MGLPRWIGTSLIAACSGPALAAAASADPSTILEELAASTLDAARAISVENLVIEAGFVELDIRHGTLFPATPVSGRVREIVFLGDARVRVDPPDRIESDQLEFHTGSPRLAEPVSEAVLVICHDAALDAVLQGKKPATPSAEALARASDLFREWHASKEREVVGARAGILLDALGDPTSESYFAGRFSGSRLGVFLALVDPHAPEQITVGQFVPADLTNTEEREVRRYIRRQQRRDRLLGLTLDGLGTFDVWLKAPLRDGSGRPTPGAPPFSATHYAMEITIDRSGQRLAGKSAIAIQSTAGLRRIVQFSMDRDLRLLHVRDDHGTELPFVQDFATVHAVLAEPLPNGRGQIEVEFEGPMIEKVQGTLFALTNTQSWYPHVGVDERATYDVTFRWPQEFDVVAAGRRTAGEATGGQYWERRVLDVPVQFFSFELGRFDFKEDTLGSIRLRYAFDRRTDISEQVQAEIMRTALDALSFYQQVYGPYPLQDLTIVTAPRGFAQGLLSFVSLPSILMLERGLWSASWLPELEDRRMILAHELAHQWWGNLLGWESYRDQWLSEAMATHAASRWAAHLPEHLRPSAGQMGHWQTDLQAPTHGRAVESIGPLVLGSRLDSSKASAMEPIIYRKGAVVLGMLEQVLGPEAFYGAQRTMLGVANYRDISTETYIEAVERLTGVDLDWFAERYVYGTGIPTVLYRHETPEPEPDGKWRVKVEARLVPRYAFRHRVKRLVDGRLDVRRTMHEAADPDEAALAVPFAIAVRRDDVDPRLQKVRNMRRAGDRYYNAVVDGRAFLQGAVTRLDLAVDWEPIAFWLDPDETVLGHFIPERDAGTLLRLQEAYAAEAAGDLDTALAALERVAAESQDQDESLQAEIDLYTARLSLDTGQLERAQQSLERFERRPGMDVEDPGAAFLEARLHTLRGEYGEASKLLRRDMLRRPWRLSAEGVLVLAIAAKRLGDQEALELALESARDRAADVTELLGDPSN